MPTATLPITYQRHPGASAVTDPFWLRLEQEGVTDDIATPRSAAALIDATFDIEPCETAAESEEQAGPQAMADLEGPTLEDLEEAAKEVLDLAICDIAPDGSVEVQVRVIRARLDYPYTLRVTGGEVVRTSTIEAEHQWSATVADADQVQVDYPILGGLSVSWQGGTTGGEPPEIHRTGTTLHWDRQLSGVLQATYLTRYDLVTIKVYGDQANPGETGEATIRCFCHGLVEELVPELPEPDENDRDLCPESTWEYEQEDEVTCFRTVVVHRRCRCSREEWDSYEYDEEVPCPDGAPVRCPNNDTHCRHRLETVSRDRYIDCPGDGYVPGTNQRYPLSDPAYYTEICCYPPASDFALPECPYETLTWGGGQTPEQDLAYYQSLYGPDTRLVGLRPEGNDPCGVWTIEHKVRPVDCCDLITELAWNDEVSATLISPGMSVEVAVSGGKAPYRWRIGGAGFSIGAPGQQAATTQTGRVTVWAGEDACGYALVRCADLCSAAQGSIRSTNGQWDVLPVEQWPAPFGLPYYDEATPLIGAGVDCVAYAGRYKVQQQFEGPWRSDAWRRDPDGWRCDLPPTDPPGCTCECLAGLQEAEFGSAPEYISRSVAAELYTSGIWHPYSEFYDADLHRWYPSSVAGVLCLDCAEQYYDYYPRYFTHWQAARLEPTEIITLWEWSCP